MLPARLRHAVSRRAEELRVSSRQLVFRAVRGPLEAYQRARGPAMALAAYKNFLLLPYHRALGSAVVGTAIVDALKAAVPGARVCAAAGGPGLQALRHHPGISKLIGAPDPRTHLLAFGRAIRAADLFGGEPFVALHTMGIDKAPFVCAGILAGASASLGFGVRAAGMTLRNDPGRSRIANDLRLVELLGHGEVDPELFQPKVYFGDEDVQAMHELLAAGGIDPGQPIAVMITQVQPYPVRQWPAASFVAVAEALYRNHGLQPVFIGAAGEEAKVDALRAALPFATVSTVGRTTIPQLAALASMARIVVGYDTGSMHVARAAGASMVILAGVDYPAIDFVPLGDVRARVLYTAPPESGRASPGEVAPAQVMDEVGELLGLYP